MFFVIMNFCSSKVAFNGYFQNSIEWLAPLNMFLALSLFIVLIYAYGSTLFEGALLEEQDILKMQDFISSRTFHASSEISDVLHSIISTSNENKELSATMLQKPTKKANFFPNAKRFIEMKVFQRSKEEKLLHQPQDKTLINTGAFSYELIDDDTKKTRRC